MAGWWLAVFLTFSSCLGQRPIFPDLPSPRIVIVGPTGSGKSSLANAFLGCDPMAPAGECMFLVGHDTDSCTKETSYGTGRWLGTGQNFTVVDTPGFLDSDSEGEALIEEMMDVLANQVDHADTMLLLFNGEDTRFTEGLQAMLKKMTLLFSQDWWNFVVIGVSFWPYTQDSIDGREERCENYPDACKDEAWFTREINAKLQEKLGVDKNFTLVFTDSFSQTKDHIDDPIEQEHWLEETGKLWEITTSREESFGFMTIDDILEENARQRAEIKWLNDVISNNISDIMARLEVNSGKIDANQVASVAANAELDSKIDANQVASAAARAHLGNEIDSKIVDVRETLGDEIDANQVESVAAIAELDTKVVHVSDDLAAVSGRVTLNEDGIDDLETEVEEEINRLDHEMSTMNLAPIGTVTAWLGGKTHSLPSGWQKCDGSIIKAGQMRGQVTPNLNGEQLFLRGGSSQQADERTVQDDRIKSHSHTLTDPGHHHTDNGHDHEDSGHQHSYIDIYNINEWGDDANDRMMGSEATTYTSRLSDVSKAQITRGFAQLSTEKSRITMGGVTEATAGSETRPKNMAVEWIMKVL